MLLSAGLTWTLSETGPPIRGLPARGRRGGTTDGSLPVERRPATLASRFLEAVALRPEVLEAAAPTGASDSATTAAEAAATTSVRTLPLAIAPLWTAQQSRHNTEAQPDPIDGPGHGGQSRRRWRWWQSAVGSRRCR